MGKIPLTEPGGFWQRRLILPIRNELTRGSSPKFLAKAVSVGVVTGIFPILGTTSLLSFLVGLVMKLNQPVVHAVRVLCYPLHLLLILPFVRLGEIILSADRVTFSIPDMLEIFMRSPKEFGSLYGVTCLHCLFAWLLCLPILASIVYFMTLPLLRKISSDQT